jgi:hypothetical protein
LESKDDNTERILIQLQGRSVSLTGYDCLSASTAVMFLFLLQWPDVVALIRCRRNATNGEEKNNGGMMEVQAVSTLVGTSHFTSPRLDEIWSISLTEFCASIASYCGSRFTWDERYTQLLRQFLAENIASGSG